MRIDPEREKTEAEVAAEQRAAHRAALERERAGYETRGLPERAAQVDEQLKKLEEDGDAAPEGDAAVEGREQSAPHETAVESKPRRTASSRGSK
ncbi:hypothetical protein [Streptomyces sp. NBC_00829]|uniref:hypothetical protein n=1 Tax=Streptomyces sp. NBC_00829 TaxID=2903679 RepID=UPI003869B4F6|nr:hypothetical protein OG293_23150 [Streptomyces sp. NBC_00829]